MSRLEKLEQRRAKIAAEIQRIRGREAAAERKSDTRRKILAGVLILSMVEREVGISKNVFFTALDKSLIRPQDRVLFNLPPLPLSTPETE